ncbi:type VI secretion system amidase effector protein Tae4 [Roseomonas sp. F4]
MAKITFEQLWSSYPSKDSPCVAPPGKQAMSNQCAIRVGIALNACGVSTKALGVTHCWYHKVSDGHVLRAQELATALQKRPPAWLGKPQTLQSRGFSTRIAGRTGIIFFKDYWMRDRDREGRPTGDHIDLWNGSRLTDMKSWLRVQMGIVIPGIWSDLEAAAGITFWQVD